MNQFLMFKSHLDRAISANGDSTDPTESGPCPIDEWDAVDQGLLSEDNLIELYAECYGIEIVDKLEGLKPSAEFLTMVPIDYARRSYMFGLESSDQRLTLAISNPHQVNAIDDVSRLTSMSVDMILATRENILEAINRAYEKQATVVDEVVEQWDASQIDQELQSLEASDDLLDMANRAPVIKLVNSVLFEAIRQQASDVHIQPEEQGVLIRFRVDGVLYDRMPVPQYLLAPMVSRIKIMGRMNVSERRIPQDGRCTARIGSRIVDLRISSIPCSSGERIVLRLLDKGGFNYSLEQLGMEPQMQSAYEQMLQSSHGIILITGPTGSGKTTTLYGSLQRLKHKEQNIITIEDPIEYQLDGISQMQINTKKGVTFASGLRHILRQDPDVIMVGEIRDEETARMAVQSSLTGHLVFATLHTNDAPSAVARMLDLGVEPYLVASSLIGVMGQRLIRRLCPDCKQACSPGELETVDLVGACESEYKDTVVYREVGCRQCLQRGFIGREAVFELLQIDSAVRQCISNRVEANQIRMVAKDAGFQSLRMNGISKVLQGTTTLSEVLRVTLQEE